MSINYDATSLKIICDLREERDAARAVVLDLNARLNEMSKTLDAMSTELNNLKSKPEPKRAPRKSAKSADKAKPADGETS